MKANQHDNPYHEQIHILEDALKGIGFEFIDRMILANSGKFGSLEEFDEVVREYFAITNTKMIEDESSDENLSLEYPASKFISLVLNEAQERCKYLSSVDGDVPF